MHTHKIRKYFYKILLYVMVLFFSMYIAVFNWKHISIYYLFKNKDILFIFTKAMKTL